MTKTQGTPAGYAGKGTVGGSLAYLLVTVPTEWLQVLPAVPEAFLLPTIGALGVVLTAILGLAFKRKETP